MSIVKIPAHVVRRSLSSLSGVGLVLGALFFAAALTPTLVPRSYLTQGVLAGACFTIGYEIGVLWRWLWHYLELPEPSTHIRSAVNLMVAAGCFVIIILFLWRAAEWQNSIRAAMDMELVETAHPLKVSAIALITFFALLVLAQSFKLATSFLSARIRRFIPRRIANLVGLLLVVVVVWSIANNLLIRAAFSALDSSFRELDALLEPERRSLLRSDEREATRRW